MKMVIDQLKFNMDTKMFPIIGYPMSQSSAAFAYNIFLVANGINEVMWPVEIPEGGLPDFIAAVKILGLRHFSVTMPYKSAIIQYLDDVDEESRLFNSVNFVRIKDGKSKGIGLDGKGALQAIRQAGVDVEDKNVLILGAGSIVGVILYQLGKAGVKKAAVINRSLERAEAVAAKVKPYVDMEIGCFPLENAIQDEKAAECDLLVQCTPLGMFGYQGGDHTYLGFIDKLKPDAVFMETIVNPPETSLMKRAKARGHKVIYGIDMMVGNKVDAFRFGFDITVTAEQMDMARRNVYRYFNLERLLCENAR